MFPLRHTHCECGMLTANMKKVCYHPDESCIVQFNSTGPAMTWHVLHLHSRHTNVAHKSHCIYRNFASIVLNSRFFSSSSSCFAQSLIIIILVEKNQMLRSSCWKKRKKKQSCLSEMLMTDVITLYVSNNVNRFAFRTFHVNGTHSFVLLICIISKMVQW